MVKKEREEASPIVITPEVLAFLANLLTLREHRKLENPQFSLSELQQLAVEKIPLPELQKCMDMLDPPVHGKEFVAKKRTGEIFNTLRRNGLITNEFGSVLHDFQGVDAFLDPNTAKSLLLTENHLHFLNFLKHKKRASERKYLLLKLALVYYLINKNGVLK